MDSPRTSGHGRGVWERVPGDIAIAGAEITVFVSTMDTPPDTGAVMCNGYPGPAGCQNPGLQDPSTGTGGAA